MKRFIALILALVLCLSLFSCSSSLEAETGGESTTQGKTEDATKDEGGKLKKIPPIADKLSWEKINSFPVVGENMTPDEARELCVSFLRFCLTFAWTPDESLSFVRNNKGNVTNLRAGTVYGGLPYGGVSSGNVYRLMEYYDEETGVVDISRAAPEGDTLLFANQCSIGAYWGWGRAINSADYRWTYDMTWKNGFLPVGNYTYDKNIDTFNQYSTAQVCKDNGENVMYESYAQMKPADGLVAAGDDAGHVVMCSSIPNVVRVNGVIDPEKSTFTVLDQGQAFKEMKQSDGSKFLVQGGVDRTITFKGALEATYVPFTFAEFLGTDETESPSATLGLGESASIDEFRAATLKSNYGISDIFVTFLDEDGNRAGQRTIRSTTAGWMEVEMGTKFMGGALQPYIGKTVKIEVQQSSGVKLVAWEGTLTE